MDGLRVKVGNEERIFLPNGDVAVVSSNTQTVRGKWRSAASGSEPKENTFRYTIDGANQQAIPVKYSFNEFNQLVVAISGDANANPFVYQGQIVIDDAHDIVYGLITKENVKTNHTITVYGDLGFNDDSNALTIKFSSGDKASIKGETGISSIRASNNIFDFEADDLLRFFAVTRNDLSISNQRVPVKADIKFVGNWDLKQNGEENQLVFVSNVKTGSGTKTVTLGFAGKVGAVTAGFAYYADKEGKNLAFTIKGEHKWESSEAKWNLALGYSKKIFKASIDGEFVKNMPDGQFKLSGKMSLELGGDKPAKMSFEVQGTYEFKNNQLVFKASASTEENRYDLSLEGKFVFKGGTLTFQAKYNKQGKGTNLEIKLETTANKERLKAFLKIILEKDNVSLTAGFELRVRWKDGVTIDGKPTKELVKEAPKPV